ncbi:MAG: peptidase M41, partial [Crocinitomicaceae bacterium]|nr:peptidase M41 [Crocinitomicaceae bacterium]
GNISYYDSRGGDMFTKPYSDDRARIIDEEVSKMIESQYERALELLTKNKEKLTALANKLLSQEVIFKEDLELIFGKREWEKNDIVETVEATAEEVESSGNKKELESIKLTEPTDSVEDQTEIPKPPMDSENEEELND